MKEGIITIRNMGKGSIIGLMVRFSRVSGYMEKERVKGDI